MNRPLTLTAAIAFTALGFSAPAHADDTASGTIDVQATCDGLTVTTAGWPEGSDGIVGFGANPPWSAPVNASGTFLGWHPSGDRIWSVMVRGPGQVDQVLQGTISCDATAPAVLVEAVAQPVVVERPRREVEGVQFGNYQIAPPEQA